MYLGISCFREFVKSLFHSGMSRDGGLGTGGAGEGGGGSMDFMKYWK